MGPGRRGGSFFPIRGANGLRVLALAGVAATAQTVPRSTSTLQSVIETSAQTVPMTTETVVAITITAE